MCGSDVSKEYLKRFPAIVIKLKVIVANKRNQVSRNTFFCRYPNVYWFRIRETVVNQYLKNVSPVFKPKVNSSRVVFSNILERSFLIDLNLSCIGHGCSSEQVDKPKPQPLNT